MDFRYGIHVWQQAFHPVSPPAVPRGGGLFLGNQILEQDVLFRPTPNFDENRMPRLALSHFADIVNSGHSGRSGEFF